MIRVLFFSILGTFLAPLSAMPRYVLIISYAEFNSSFNLTTKGEERALALPFYFTETLAPTYGTPKAIFGARESAATLGGDRILATGTPTSGLIGQQMHLGFAKENPQALVDTIMNTALYDNETILIVWDFASIPSLITAFGFLPPTLPAPPRFDRTYVLAFPLMGPQLPVTLFQSLLFGDQP